MLTDADGTPRLPRRPTLALHWRPRPAPAPQLPHPAAVRAGFTACPPLLAALPGGSSPPRPLPPPVLPPRSPTPPCPPPLLIPSTIAGGIPSVSILILSADRVRRLRPRDLLLDPVVSILTLPGDRVRLGVRGIVSSRGLPRFWEHSPAGREGAASSSLASMARSARRSYWRWPDNANAFTWRGTWEQEPRLPVRRPGSARLGRGRPRRPRQSPSLAGGG
jgi:hypothetical protein